MLYLPPQSLLYNYTYYEEINWAGIRMHTICTLASRTSKQ
jgi:hypothetical protein